MTDQTGATRFSTQNDERGRGHGLTLILFLLQQSRWTLVAIPVVIATLAAGLAGWHWAVFVATLVGVPLVIVGAFIAWLILGSRRGGDGPSDWAEHVSWRDPKAGEKWAGRKIPMEILYEAYMAEELDFDGDVYDVLLRRNQLFSFRFTWGDLKFYVRDFLGQNVTHTPKSDAGDIAPVYNRGNDFYNWFLGETMTYTSGIFQDPSESLEDAQRRKLDLVCKTVQMKEGDRHLDIGCGWGPLITHAAKHYGSQSTGVTIAKEQAEWAAKVAEDFGVTDKVDILVDDYRKIPAAKYDKVTCLEMAEHVGIKNFQKFLLQVRSLLEDDGIFYLQIAGLRREWQFEDLVWGLFMGKYIFPGADASCPLGFVVDQLERGGFEVHRVENCGVHYSVTIRKWYENWRSNEEAIVAAYGQRWFRMWMIFLAWSSIIAAQGSSTVFMISATKNTGNDKSSVSPEEADAVPFSRTERWIGPDTVGTQR